VRSPLSKIFSFFSAGSIRALRGVAVSAVSRSPDKDPYLPHCQRRLRTFDKFMRGRGHAMALPWAQVGRFFRRCLLFTRSPASTMPVQVPACCIHSRIEARRQAFLSRREKTVAPPTVATTSEDTLQISSTQEPRTVLAHDCTPRAPSTDPSLLPFRVRRSKRGGSLPVYASYKNANTRVITTLRNVDGDIVVSINKVSTNYKICASGDSCKTAEIFSKCSSIAYILYVPVPMQTLQEELARLTGSPVSQRPGRIEIKGHHTKSIREYLLELGL
jgi:hypothetical protein